MKSRRTLILWFTIIFGACLLVVAASIALNKIVQKKIEEKLSTLAPAVMVKFSSFQINLLSSSASFDKLQLAFSPYANLPQKKHSFYFTHASLKGISFLGFLFTKNLAADKLILDEGNIQFDQFLLDKKDSAQGKVWAEMKRSFKQLSIGRIELERAKVLSSVKQGFQTVAKGDVTLGQVHMSSNDSMFHFEKMDCNLSAISYPIPHSNDSIQIHKLVMNSRDNTLQIDSLDFRSVNKASIPSITASGFEVSQLLNDKVLTIDKIKINQALISVARKERSVNAMTLPFDLKEIKMGAFEFTNASLWYKDSLTDCRLGATVFLNEVDVNSLNRYGFHFGSARCSVSNLHYSGDHNVDVKSIYLDSKKGTMEVGGVRLDANSSNKAVVPIISATGIDLRHLLKDHLLIIKKLKVDKATLSLSGNKIVTGSQVLPFGLNKIRVDNFEFSNGFLFYKNKANECYFKTDIYLDSLNVNLLNADRRFASARCSFSDIHYSGNVYHDVVIKSINLDSKKEIIEVNNLQTVPQFGKYEFDKKIGHQADRIEATIPKIEIIKPQFEELLHQKLFAEKIKISGSKAYIFRDRRLPRPQTISLLPMDYLKTAPIEMRVKSCELASSNVEYEEYPASGYGETGIFRLVGASATVSPLINHPLETDPDYLVMKVSASVMGTGTATATMMMPVRKNKPYRIKGVFERLDLPKLNSSSENLGKIRIKSGFLDFLSFDFTMTNQESNGQIIGAYHGLVIQQLKKHTKEKNVAEFSSFMLRQVIIPLNKDQSMPEKKRTGRVSYRRDPTRFVTYYYLHTLLRAVEASFTLGFLLPK